MSLTPLAGSTPGTADIRSGAAQLGAKVAGNESIKRWHVYWINEDSAFWPLVRIATVGVFERASERDINPIERVLHFDFGADERHL
jgi:hypothetical protein